MIPLNLPAFAIKTTSRQGRTLIYDVLRRRYVALTPEEWVRQHFIHFLIEHKHYPAALLANEVTLQLNGTRRRCDSVLYARDGGRPRLIVEYKAPDVRISSDVFEQATRYNAVLGARYVILTNGLTHFCFERTAEGYATMGAFPDLTPRTPDPAGP